MRKKPRAGTARPWRGMAYLWCVCIVALGLLAGLPARAETPEASAFPALTQGELAGETVLATGDVPEFVSWLLEVAEGELGYKEGARGYTQYGEWAGDPYAQWCAEFLCWCVDQVDQRHQTSLLQNIYPQYSSQNTGRDWFIARGRFVYRKGNCPDWGYQWLWGKTEILRKNDYIPRPGDWVFFSYNGAGDTAHVALVEYCAQDEAGDVVIHVIEGNNPSSVQRNVYRLNNSQVLGFGVSQDVVGTTMRSGNRGDKVTWLQEGLCQLGYLEAQHITGAFGGNTKAAVASFQATLPEQSSSGIADMETQNALVQALAQREDSQPETWLVVE